LPTRIAWTGHRPAVFHNPRSVADCVARLARQAINQQAAPEFICGGQRGVDTWASIEAVRASVPFRLILPSHPSVFAAVWSRDDRAVLDQLLSRATSADIIDRDGTLGSLAFDLRNEALVRNASVLVAVWCEIRRGGTFGTICAGRAGGVRIEEHHFAPALSILSGRGL